MLRILHIIGLAALVAAWPALAAEFAVLRTGATLAVDRHESAGGKLRLYSDGGFVEMTEELVDHFEARPDPPAAPKAPEPVPVVIEQPAPPPSNDPHALAESAARKFGLPEEFVRSVMKAESGFQPHAVSPKGAMGLMQLMPDTARELGVDPANPRENAEGGAKYLRELLAKYENEPDQVVLALAAYNAGPAAVERYHGVPPYDETRAYIVRVLRDWERQRNATARAIPQ